MTDTFALYYRLSRETRRALQSGTCTPNPFYSYHERIQRFVEYYGDAVDCLTMRAAKRYLERAT